MHSKWILLSLVALLVAAGLFQPAWHPTVEAGGSWSAWVYNYETGKMVHVFPDGAAGTERYFPLPPGTSTYPTEIVISRDGSYMAACLTDDAGNPSVRVYDLYSNVYIAAYIPIAPITACALSRYSFSEDGSQVAFGILNNFFDDTDTRPDWEVVVMQMNTSAVLYRIDANSPQIAALGRDYSHMLPVVSTFQMTTGTFPGLLTFMPVMYATEGAQEYDSLVWNLSDNSVMLSGPYGKANLDVLGVISEGIWTDINASYPQGTLMGPGYLYNVVMYSNKAGDNFPIFTNGMVLWESRFVDDGRMVAIHGYTAPGPGQWFYLKRDSSIGTLPIPPEVYAVWGTLDGYTYLTPAAPGVGAQVRYDRFVGGSTTPEQYVAWTGEPGAFYRMVWVNPLSGGNGLPFFSSIPMLAPPIAVTATPLPTLPPPVVITATPTTFPFVPTATPTSYPMTLIVGGHATVHTTEGDVLRVRSGAGTSFAVVFQLPNGALVTLLEGPVSAGGYNWWRIQAADGQTGWAIDGLVDNGVWLQTLVPSP